jgi:hypothetical protein
MRVPSSRLPAAARFLALLLLALTLAGGSVLPPAGVSTASAQADPRYFADTGFRIDDDKIWDYFNKRGGQRTFGLPTSRTFPFLGAPTQFFQRHVLQVGSSGVRTLNLLDDGLLPYTTIGGSTFPAVDPAVVAEAPKAGSPTYDADVAAYLEKHAPNTFDGEPVGFLDAFNDTVRLADAFPDGGGSVGLLTLLNLEIWGLPTSKPARDPGNSNFIFVRFQRGVMHYDAACTCTQGLLLADALKAIITGTNLPDDLAAQAADSPLFGQYSTEVHNGPLKQGLPGGTELANAFRPSLDAAAAGPVPALQPAAAQSGSPAATPEVAARPETAAAPKPSAAPSGPPQGDPKEYLAKIADAGKGAQEQEKEFKKGGDNAMVWASNRIERDRTWANYNSGPVTIASKIIIAHNSEAAKKIFEDEKKLNEKFPEAKDKVGGKFEFNMAGDQDVGEEAAGLSACIASGCAVKDDDDNLIHRRMVFRLQNFVGVVYTFGMSVPEGNTQLYSRLIAEKMVGRIRKDL